MVKREFERFWQEIPGRYVPRLRSFIVSGAQLQRVSKHGSQSHILCIRVPHEVVFRHTAPTMRTNEPFLLEGWFVKSKHDGHQGKARLDPGEISNSATKQRGLGAHEVSDGHPFRKDLDEVMDL